MHLIPGKYVPSLSWKIHTMNELNTTSMKMPLRGLAIGDGLYDPSQQLDYGDHLYQVTLPIVQKESTPYKIQEAMENFVFPDNL